MQYAIIIDNVIDNIAEADEALASNWELLQAGAGRGWVRSGPGQPFEPPTPPAPAVPESVTRAQGKAALIGAGLWPGVQAYVASIPDPTQQALAEVALNDTLEWRRDNPFLAACADGIGLTFEQLDALFIAAAQIVL